MKQYIYTTQAAYTTLLTNPTGEDVDILEQQQAYQQTLIDDGIGIFFGETDTIVDSRHIRLCVFQASDDDAAKSILHADPAVRHRVVRGCVYPMRVSLWNEAGAILTDTQRHFFYKIQPVRPEMLTEAPTEQEGAAMQQHFMYLKSMVDAGDMLCAGPTLVTDYSNFGLGILKADSLEAAWAIGENDPAVQYRVMRLDILAFKLDALQQGYINS